MELNRVKTALDRWDTKQAGYIQKFGQELLQDREFNLLRLQVWKRIIKQHRKLNLSEDEFYDLQFVKGQIRQMDAALFPGIKGFFQKLNYSIARAIDRIFTGKPTFLKDSGMITVATKSDQEGNVNHQSEKNGLSSVYIAPELKADKQLPTRQSEDVVVQTAISAAILAPQTALVVEQSPEISPQSEKVVVQTAVSAAILVPQPAIVVEQSPEISPQSENVVVQTAVSAAIPAPQPAIVVEQSPEISPQSENVVVQTAVSAAIPAPQPAIVVEQSPEISPQSENVVVQTAVSAAIPAPQPAIVVEQSPEISPQSENVVVQTAVSAAIPAPQPSLVVEQSPEVSPQSPNETTTETTILQQRKSFQRNNEIKTLTGRMRTLR
ncbi:hypothetical protein [Chitinophaga silvisoli]|uniref:Uncharacterized protein n=1 Tax=Chitinophaga silvisoli TaxID=2291814 RepID=A0A3E1P2R2_9BACT|nr:hypothetical protein [Chitinophaga silvisoli]RFM34420.1 hypothetical protein DXN04_14155 [Chitinophaga silvisoli]